MPSEGMSPRVSCFRMGEGMRTGVRPSHLGLQHLWAAGQGAVSSHGAPAGPVQGKLVQSWISGRSNGVLYFAFIDLSERLP